MRVKSKRCSCSISLPRKYFHKVLQPPLDILMSSKQNRNLFSWSMKFHQSSLNEWTEVSVQLEWCDFPLKIHRDFFQLHPQMYSKVLLICWNPELQNQWALLLQGEFIIPFFGTKRIGYSSQPFKELQKSRDINKGLYNKEKWHAVSIRNILVIKLERALADSAQFSEVQQDSLTQEWLFQRGYFILWWQFQRGYVSRWTLQQDPWELTKFEIKVSSGFLPSGQYY